MAALQKPVSSSVMGILAAGCLLFIALWAQGGAAGPVSSHCKLDKSYFSGYITNHTFLLAAEASLADNNTDVRLIKNNFFSGIHKNKHCYLMKQVLNFTLEEVLPPQSDRFQRYMKEVVAFFSKCSKELSLCHIRGDDQHIQRKVQELKDTVTELGESAGIKAIGELNLLFMNLKDACVLTE
ncbi:interleukin-22 [Ctenodactylus gundi]